MKFALPVKSVKAIVKKEIRKNEEIKELHIDSTAAPTLGNWSGTIVQLSPVATGVGYNNKIGVNIRMTSVKLCWQASTSAAATTFIEKNSNIRVIIFQYHPLAATPPVPNTILESVANVYTMVSPYSLNNKYDYTVLYDAIVPLRTSDAAANNYVYREVLVTGNKFLKRDMHYAGASATIQTNGIYMLVITEVPNAGNIPGFLYHSTFRFTDA